MHRYSTLGVTVTLGNYFTTTFFIVPSLILTMWRITINDFDLSIIYTKKIGFTLTAQYINGLRVNVNPFFKQK